MQYVIPHEYLLPSFIPFLIHDYDLGAEKAEQYMAGEIEYDKEAATDLYEYLQWLQFEINDEMRPHNFLGVR